MNWLYCWRCGRDVPMLDEGQAAVVERLYRDCTLFYKQMLANRIVSHSPAEFERFLTPVRDAYERFTGSREASAKTILHHFAAIYGPPCEACGKPLRTPGAAFCAACGLARGAATSPSASGRG